MQCKEHVDVVKTPRFHFTFLATLLPATSKKKRKTLCSRPGPEPPPFSPKQFPTPASDATAREPYIKDAPRPVLYSYQLSHLTSPRHAHLSSHQQHLAAP